MELSGNLPKRLASADIYRGLVMFLMMAEVFDFSKIASKTQGNPFWQFLGWHQSHVEWVGCSLHDMIQPSFSFLVGLVLPFSIQNHNFTSKSAGILKTLKRALILIFLGVFLRSMHSESTNWTFEDTLSQIGLGYFFLYLLAFKDKKIQMFSLVTILVLYWLAFAIYPLPSPNFNYDLAKTTSDWSFNLSGFGAHWNKNTNFAWAFDTWFLNLFSREKEFTANGGGYATLSFIPTLATMILGLLAGNILIAKTVAKQKLKIFIKYAIALILSGLALHFLNICPIVKRIWTPAWVLFSGGICYLFMAFFYFLADVKNGQEPFFWLKVIGTNSIATYVLAHTITDFIKKTFEIHLGNNVYQFLGPAYETLVSGTVIMVVLWLILFWLYRKKLFIKI